MMIAGSAGRKETIMKTNITLNIDIERLFDLVVEWNDAEYDYRKSSRDLYKKRGYGVNLDKGNKTPEEKHIEYMYHSSNTSSNVITSIIEVMSLDRDQICRLYSAARAYKRWYQDTEWQICMPEELKDRLFAYVIG